jgi:hypothetical protein
MGLHGVQRRRRPVEEGRTCNSTAAQARGTPVATYLRERLGQQDHLEDEHAAVRCAVEHAAAVPAPRPKASQPPRPHGRRGPPAPPLPGPVEGIRGRNGSRATPGSRPGVTMHPEPAITLLPNGDRPTWRGNGRRPVMSWTTRPKTCITPKLGQNRPAVLRRDRGVL